MRRWYGYFHRILVLNCFSTLAICRDLSATSPHFAPPILAGASTHWTGISAHETMEEEPAEQKLRGIAARSLRRGSDCATPKGEVVTLAQWVTFNNFRNFAMGPVRHSSV